MTANRIPYGGRLLPQPTMMACPWCHTEREHPPGSPKCQADPNDVKSRQISVGGLVAWAALTLTEVITQFVPATVAEVEIIKSRMVGEEPPSC